MAPWHSRGHRGKEAPLTARMRGHLSPRRAGGERVTRACGGHVRGEQMEVNMIRRIKFMGIPVLDQDRALEFYVNTLGFVLVTDQPMGPGQRWIEVRPPRGETGVALFTPEGHEGRVGTFANTSWECDDVEKTYRELTAKGVEFPRPPERQPWGVMAIMKDSEGNQIVLSAGR